MTDAQPQPDAIRFAALAAHQLRSPVTAVQGILRTLMGDFAGPLSDEQKEFLARADRRCDEAILSVRRMLSIADVLARPGQVDQSTDLAAVVRGRLEEIADPARQRSITLSAELDAEPAWVVGHPPALTEAIDALLNNALKYTPDHGRIRVHLGMGEDDGHLQLTVGDSGVGIAPGDRQRIFDPFYRTRAAGESSRPGSGLGLSLVKAVVTASGGTITAGQSPLGGALFDLRLPSAQPARQAQPAPVRSASGPRVVIIGGVAAGPKVASKVIRLQPDAVVTVVEKGRFLSYAGCGLPYYISGAVRQQRQLMSTPLGAVRDPVFFQNVKNVRILDQTEAVSIDRSARQVLVRDVASGRESRLDYDKLVLATGAQPVVPDVAGVKLANVFGLHGVRDAEGIRALLAEHRARDVVIVGGGLIGVEATEALAHRGSRVTIIEQREQILRMLDWEMARLVERHLESHGVRVRTHTQVLRFEGEQGAVSAVVTDRGTIQAEMVIVGIGIRPEVGLARRAGLAIGDSGAIRVDAHLRTSDPDIYAAGDCTEQTHLLTGQPTYVPLGSTANKQGRVAAVNLCGGDDVFPGVLGSTICRVFEYCVARTGLTQREADEAGFDAVSVLTPAPDRAHYMPDARMLLIKLVADRASRKLLGVQAVGAGDGAKRIDVAAMALTTGMTVDQLAHADLCYAPPYSPAIDNLITAANVARNKLDGHMNGISPMAVKQMLDDGGDLVLLDVRSPDEVQRHRLPGSTFIPLGALRGRLDELPRDKPIIAFCEISLRGYEAALILRAAGFDDVRVMDGGLAMWPYDLAQ